MTDDEAFEIIRRHFQSLFPLTCPSCGRRYAELRDYILNTKRVGQAISYDAEAGVWDATVPVGTLALANCACGTTLGLSTRGMELSQRRALLGWIKDTTERRGIQPSELLEEVRDRIRKLALDNPARCGLPQQREACSHEVVVEHERGRQSPAPHDLEAHRVGPACATLRRW